MSKSEKRFKVYRIAILIILNLCRKEKSDKIQKIIEENVDIDPKDYSRTESDTDTIWKNEVRWERQNMVNEGLLKSDSHRGEWEITDKGRKYLQNYIQNKDKS